MNYNHIFSSSLLKIDSLKDFSFSRQDDSSYFLRRDLLSGNFYADFHLNVKEKTLEVHLFDRDTGEKYPLFDSPKSHGSFVAGLREEVQSIIDDFREKCFLTKDLREAFFSFVEKRFSALPEYPWKVESPKKEETSSSKKSGLKTDAYADYAVFRCPNKKWFALVGHVSYRQLGFSLENADEKVWCVNLKAAPEDIPSLIDKKSIFPAFHMNKKHWITVILTAVSDFDKISSLTEKSYQLVMGKKKQS